MLNKGKEHVFKKRINGANVGSIMSFMVLMSFFLWLSSSNLMAVIIDVFLIVLFSFILLLYFVGWYSYELTLSEQCITEKKLFKKEIVCDWKEFKKIAVSLDGDVIYLYGEKLCLSLRSMKHADRLAACLCQKIGCDRVEIGATKHLETL